jgi:hypothetical protein
MSQALLTRNDCRKLGLNYTNTTFQRYEKEYNLLTPIKPGQRPSSRVYYRREEVEKLIDLKLD